MKRASMIAISIVTFFYFCCGVFGYAAFGDKTPGNLLTGFKEPFWIVDLANVFIILHLLGAYQVRMSLGMAWPEEAYQAVGSTCLLFEVQSTRVPWLWAFV